MCAGCGSFLILKVIISYPIVMIIVLNVKFFFFLNKVLNVILTFEFGMRKEKLEGWRLVIIVK